MATRRRASAAQRHSGPLVGALVDAFLHREPRRSRASCIAVLGNKTSARYFAGTHRARHWCCRVTALVRELVDGGWFARALREPLPAPFSDNDLTELLFLALASVIARFDALSDAGGEDVADRALLRLATVDVATRTARFRTAFGYPSLADVRPSVGAGRGSLLRALRARIRPEPTFAAMAEDTGIRADSLVDWFTRDKRPTRDSIGYLVRYFAARLPDVEKSDLRARLYWHYALNALTERVGDMYGDAFADELVRVFDDVVKCHGAAIVAHPREVLVLGFASGIMTFANIDPAITCVAEHLGHDAWDVDLRDAHRAWRNVAAAEQSAALGIAFPLLDRLPRRRPAVVEQ